MFQNVFLITPLLTTIESQHPRYTPVPLHRSGTFFLWELSCFIFFHLILPSPLGSARLILLFLLFFISHGCSPGSRPWPSLFPGSEGLRHFRINCSRRTRSSSGDSRTPDITALISNSPSVHTLLYMCVKTSNRKVAGVCQTYMVWMVWSLITGTSCSFPTYTGFGE